MTVATIASELSKRRAGSSRSRTRIAEGSDSPSTRSPSCDHSSASSSRTDNPIAWISSGVSVVVVWRATAAAYPSAPPGTLPIPTASSPRATGRISSRSVSRSRIIPGRTTSVSSRATVSRSETSSMPSGNVGGCSRWCAGSEARWLSSWAIAPRTPTAGETRPEALASQ